MTVDPRPLDEPLVVDLPGARAAFTNRHGGVSRGPYRSLNLGRLTDDDPDSVRRNRELLAGRIGMPLAMIRQVHGAEVRRVESSAPAAGPLLQADGQAVATAGVAPMVLTADCLPIAIAGEGAVAMVHAGWRGLAGGVVGEGVAALRSLGVAGMPSRSRKPVM